jgi:hypothetical protein
MDGKGFGDGVPIEWYPMGQSQTATKSQIRRPAAVLTRATSTGAPRDTLPRPPSRRSIGVAVPSVGPQ